MLSNLPRASITPWLQAARLPFLNLILRRVRQRVRDFFQYLVMLARKPGPFWRENVLAVVTLLRSLARMSKWRKQYYLSKKLMLEVLSFCDPERA